MRSVNLFFMKNSPFSSPFYLFNGHLQTIIPSLYRKVAGVNYRRERVETPDGDFLDLDWAQEKPSTKRIVVVTHGLEGDSTRQYVLGIVKKFKDNGWDALGWNCRSCSGEPNRLPRFYHHGDASDVRFVIDYAIKQGYEQVAMVGFSMGGSLTLRALAEFPEWVPAQVLGGAAFSVPLDLPTSVIELYKPSKRMYMNRFLRKLGVKIEAKSKLFPDLISFEGYENIKNFEQFDNKYTAPLHGYKDAHDFYAQASVKPHLHKIAVPVLIGQAKNDPFLTQECLELDEKSAKNTNIKLIVTPNGGHVGFTQANSSESYAEKLSFEFFEGLKK
jgi:uncharacterized protein